MFLFLWLPLCRPPPDSRSVFWIFRDYPKKHSWKERSRGKKSITGGREITRCSLFCLSVGLLGIALVSITSKDPSNEKRKLYGGIINAMEGCAGFGKMPGDWGLVPGFVVNGVTPSTFLFVFNTFVHKPGFLACRRLA